MSAPIATPASQTPSNQPSPQPSPTGGQPSAPNPAPTNPPASNTPDIRGELDRLGRQTISDLHSQLAEARAREALLQQRLSTQASSTPNTPPPSGADFINEPVPILRNVVNEAVRDQVAPLIALANRINRNDTYTALKAQFRGEYPQLGGMLTELEPYIDRLMSNVEPNINNIMAALTQAAGLKAMGQIPSAPTSPHTMPSSTPSASTPPATPPANGNMIPPNLPPSPPTMPSSPTKTPEQELKAKIDALTETERKTWVNLGGKLTIESLTEYINLRDGGDDVNSWYRPPQPKTQA